MENDSLNLPTLKSVQPKYKIYAEQLHLGLSW